MNPSACAGGIGTRSPPAQDRNTRAKFFLALEETVPLGVGVPACRPPHAARSLSPTPHLPHERQISTPQRQQHGRSRRQRESTCPEWKSRLLHGSRSGLVAASAPVLEGSRPAVTNARRGPPRAVQPWSCLGSGLTFSKVLQSLLLIPASRKAAWTPLHRLAAGEGRKRPARRGDLHPLLRAPGERRDGCCFPQQVHGKRGGDALFKEDVRCSCRRTALGSVRCRH